MAVDVDDDTLKACLALWKADPLNTLAALFKQPPQTGRLKSPQALPYAHIESQKGRDSQRYTGGVRKDYRKATITLRGAKPDVTKGLGFVLTLFSSQLGAPGKPTLAYPSTDQTGLPRFLCWWPLNEGVLTQDPAVKAGDDVWMGVVEGEIRSVRLD